MDEQEALQELDAVLGDPQAPEEPQACEACGNVVCDCPEAEIREGTCFACGADLNPVHDRENECQACFYGRLSVAQRCELVSESVLPVAEKWGQAEVLAKLKEALAVACTLAESRDSRLVGQWADGFMAGLVAGAKLRDNITMTDATFQKLVAEVNSDPVPTGD